MDINVTLVTSISVAVVVFIILLLKFLDSIKKETPKEAVDIEVKFKQLLAEAKVGDTVYFGEYVQGAESKDPIEWLVLFNSNNRALLLSKHGLDCKAYHFEAKNVSWEKSRLRSWLNEEFISNAFANWEEKYILSDVVINNNNSLFNTVGGKSTQDKVFLLSIEEALKYFDSDEKRIIYPTPLAVKHGAFVSKDTEGPLKLTTCYWLRTPGDKDTKAALVNNDGSINYSGFGVEGNVVSIRPAIWVRV